MFMKGVFLKPEIREKLKETIIKTNKSIAQLAKESNFSYSYGYNIINDKNMRLSAGARKFILNIFPENSFDDLFEIKDFNPDI